MPIDPDLWGDVQAAAGALLGAVASQVSPKPDGHRVKIGSAIGAFAAGVACGPWLADYFETSTRAGFVMCGFAVAFGFDVLAPIALAGMAKIARLRFRLEDPDPKDPDE